MKFLKTCVLALALLFSPVFAHAQNTVPSLQGGPWVWDSINVFPIGDLQFSTTPNPCPSGQFTNGLDATLSVICGNPISSGDVNALNFSGGDLGAQVNAAYASCTSGPGCRIVIPPGNYNVTTPIVIATKGKEATVECGGTNTTLTWTGSGSASMFTFAANGGSPATGNGWGAGIKFCNITSASTTATAITFGLSPSDVTGRSAQGSVLEDSQITGFGTQLLYASQAWNIQVIHTELLNPAVHAVWMDTTAVNSGENLSFVGVTVGNSLSTWMTQAVYLNNGNVITTWTNSNFDNAEFVCPQGTCNLVSPYFENPGSPAPVRSTAWLDDGSGGVMTVTGLTAADDAASATQPAITVEGTVTWIGGTIFGQHPATATVVTSGGGHVWMGGDLDLSASVPTLINNSALSAVNLNRGAPEIINQAFKETNPVLTGAAHWYGLEQSDGSVTYDTFLEQMATDDSTNPSGFEICNEYSAVFFCEIQVDKSGHFLGLHGPFSSSWNQWLYGLTRIDSLSINGGAPIATANAIPTVGTPTVGHGSCIKAAGPPVLLGYCSTVMASDGSCTCN